MTWLTSRAGGAADGEGRRPLFMLVGCGRVRAHLAGGGVALACALASSAHLTTSKDGHAESKAARQWRRAASVAASAEFLVQELPRRP